MTIFCRAGPYTTGDFSNENDGDLGKNEFWFDCKVNLPVGKASTSWLICAIRADEVFLNAGRFRRFVLKPLPVRVSLPLRDIGVYLSFLDEMDVPWSVKIIIEEHQYRLSFSFVDDASAVAFRLGIQG